MKKLELEMMKLIQNITLELVSVSDLDKVLLKIVNETKEKLDYDNCVIFLLEGNQLILKAISPFAQKFVGLKIPVGKEAVGRCASTKKVINIGNISKCNFYISSLLEGARSEIAIPIIYKEELCGVIIVESKEKNAFTDDDIYLLSIISSQVTMALYNAGIYAKLEKMATIDSLTGLYNYRYFKQRLDQEIERAIRYNRKLSLLLLDIDDFRKMVDNFGRLEGDELLRLVSQAIKANLRRIDEVSVIKDIDIDIAIDIATRYVGDEFMIILPETSLKGAIFTAQRLQKIIEENVGKMLTFKDKEGNFVKITASFGLSSLRKGEGSKELIKKVEQAIHVAKSKGKNSIYWLE
ncbi:MAG: diguanylate cyclase [Candidatus Aminicenantia bacterium]